jgi:hypothetical protein
MFFVTGNHSMTHTIEPASSGRAKCRGCGLPISKGELRFGERLPNPFSDDSDMTLWFHIHCASLKRPESLTEVIDTASEELEAIDSIRAAIEFGTSHHRTQRINGVERAPSGRARCRSCQEMISKDVWRIPLVIFEEGMFNSAGNIHLSCSQAYFETSSIMDRLQHFGEELSESDIAEVQEQL